MDAKHTPGPWVVGSDAGASGRMVGPMGEEEVCTVFGAGESNDPETRPECLANARLIAAAPELLAIVEGLIETISATGEVNLRTGDMTLVNLRAEAYRIVARIANPEEWGHA